MFKRTLTGLAVLVVFVIKGQSALDFHVLVLVVVNVVGVVVAPPNHAFHVAEDDERDVAIIYVISYRNQVALKRIMI
uniref:Secreted protein n=1 Tax=Meloidogyne incognita TaxID=6306 RepID=A0A914MUS0_MELIC